ncbi:sigma-70 family RNA polymerase sigma factor [Fulvivirga sp. M361]|uniref:RNA polymerase sigma factor n=1 Tax=Fulvivirga sp. M361 TaxID=2594266 RepID=UPI00117A8E86|nr:sigma-70 family RNA polymerase sigma factor [Fulvivirga sp. M361]TRX56207.1 sigma-70 family RNA polymerase sigma factor [Fulvivirga sp. M361]
MPANPDYKDPELLVAHLKNRDKAAIAYLYDHYSAAINGIILRIVKNESIAEEVLQDAFLKFWNKIDTYDSKKGRLFTWMMNISRNLAIDKLRSREIKNDLRTDEVENTVYNVNAENHSHQQIDDIGVGKLLDTLREEEKLVVDMIYFKGYTHTELAEEKNIPLGTVKTRLRMALMNLRNYLGNEE